MLKRVYRLPVSLRLKSPSTLYSPYFLAKIAPNGLHYCRFGFIVKKKVDKRATKRNRTKRVFRSCIEELRLEIKEGYDMLFFLEKGIIEKKREVLVQELRLQLSQKNLLR